MAVLYITEFRNVGEYGRTQAAEQPPQAEQTIAIGSGSVQSNAFATGTKFIRVHTDAICSIEVGANPTATSTTARLAAGQTEYFTVLQGHKLAVITNT